MSVKDTINNLFGKLPFVKLAEKIPEGARTKVPLLNTLIPFANHIASGLVVVILAANIGGGGGVASSKDFSYRLYDDDDSVEVWVSDDDGSHGVDVSISAGIWITGYSGNGGKVVIPATIEGYPVRAIAGFRGSYESNAGWRYNPSYRITELVIPEGVEFIDGGAFVGCENLKTVTLPASLKAIGGEAFALCPNLENLTIPASASFACYYNAFDNKKLPLKTRQRLVELGVGDYKF